MDLLIHFSLKGKFHCSSGFGEGVAAGFGGGEDSHGLSLLITSHTCTYRSSQTATSEWRY